MAHTTAKSQPAECGTVIPTSKEGALKVGLFDKPSTPTGHEALCADLINGVQRMQQSKARIAGGFFCCPSSATSTFHTMQAFSFQSVLLWSKTVQILEPFLKHGPRRLQEKVDSRRSTWPASVTAGAWHCHIEKAARDYRAYSAPPSHFPLPRLNLKKMTSPS